MPMLSIPSHSILSCLCLQVSSNWDEVVALCRKAHYQPLLLVYTNPFAEKINTATAPAEVTKFVPTDTAKGKSAPTLTPVMEEDSEANSTKPTVPPRTQPVQTSQRTVPTSAVQTVPPVTSSGGGGSTFPSKTEKSHSAPKPASAYSIDPLTLSIRPGGPQNPSLYPQLPSLPGSRQEWEPASGGGTSQEHNLMEFSIRPSAPHAATSLPAESSGQKSAAMSVQQPVPSSQAVEAKIGRVQPILVQTYPAPSAPSPQVSSVSSQQARQHPHSTALPTPYNQVPGSVRAQPYAQLPPQGGGYHSFNSPWQQQPYYNSQFAPPNNAYPTPQSYPAQRHAHMYPQYNYPHPQAMPPHPNQHSPGPGVGSAYSTHQPAPATAHSISRPRPSPPRSIPSPPTQRGGGGGGHPSSQQQQNYPPSSSSSSSSSSKGPDLIQLHPSPAAAILAHTAANSHVMNSSDADKKLQGYSHCEVSNNLGNPRSSASSTSVYPAATASNASPSADLIQFSLTPDQTKKLHSKYRRRQDTMEKLQLSLTSSQSTNFTELPNKSAAPVAQQEDLSASNNMDVLVDLGGGVQREGRQNGSVTSGGEKREKGTAVWSDPLYANPDEVQTMIGKRRSDVEVEKRHPTDRTKVRPHSIASELLQQEDHSPALDGSGGGGGEPVYADPAEVLARKKAARAAQLSRHGSLKRDMPASNHAPVSPSALPGEQSDNNVSGSDSTLTGKTSNCTYNNNVTKLSVLYVHQLMTCDMNVVYSTCSSLNMCNYVCYWH